MFVNRCKDLEQQGCSLAALKNVGVQAVVTEFLISHTDILFTDCFMNRRREHAAGRLFCGCCVLEKVCFLYSWVICMVMVGNQCDFCFDLFFSFSFPVIF